MADDIFAPPTEEEIVSASSEQDDVFDTAPSSEEIVRSQQSQIIEPGITESTLRGVAQGASLGFSDELSGGLGTARDVAESYLSGKETPDISSLYEQYRDLERKKNEAAQKVHPNLYGAGELGGALATSFIPGAQIGTLAKGAAIGGLTGLGRTEEETLAGQAKDVATGAALGGGGFKLGGMLGKYIKPTAEKIGSRLGTSGQKLQTIAEKPIPKLLPEGVKDLAALSAGGAAGGFAGGAGAVAARRVGRGVKQAIEKKLGTTLEQEAVRRTGSGLESAGNVLKEGVEEAMASYGARTTPTFLKKENNVLDVDKYLYNINPGTQEDVINKLQFGGFKNQANALRKAIEEKDEKKQNAILYSIAQTPEARKLFKDTVK